MSRRVLAVAVAVLAIGVLLATRSLGAGAIHEGAAALEAGELAQAEDHLRADTSLPPSAVRLYDMGVLRYRQGDVPAAIANWRAARELAPRGGDLVHNLAVARNELDTEPPTPVGPALGWMDILSPAEVGLLAWLAWLASSVLVLRWRRKHESLPTALAATGVAIVLSVAALQGRAAQLGHPPVVTLETAVVRDAADLEAGERFQLPPGSELRAEARRGAFLLVQDGQGRRGWVIAGAVEMPLPGWL